MSYFVTGTDTGVGKTYVTARLVETLRSGGHDVVACKPICCGGREDAEILAKASGGLPIDLVNPFHFEMPLAPAAAGMLEGREIPTEEILAACRHLLTEHESVVFEGIGGWQVPINRELTVAGLAARLGVPVIVVVANRLGALNHARLTVEAVQATKDPSDNALLCEGIVVNEMNEELGLAEVTNLTMLKNFAGVPMLAHVIRDQEKVHLDPEMNIELTIESDTTPGTPSP
jgi:dethiobiotin synthetase